ncbi:hypothetical protein [Bacillus wiedmannii]|nr:hypothetical protein [Bacillus wiedmannii]
MADVTKLECKDGNIYEVDGKRYRELSKEPEVGDTALVVKPQQSIGYVEGDVLILTSVNVEGDYYGFVDKVGDENGLYRDEFMVVEPTESGTPNPMPYFSDILDDIKTKLTRLEERTEENHRNILTFSQMAESARSDASKAVGGVNALDEQLDLVREGIVFLDEKVSALEEAKPPQNITININVLDVESAKAIVESITKGRE